MISISIGPIIIIFLFMQLAELVTAEAAMKLLFINFLQSLQIFFTIINDNYYNKESYYSSRLEMHVSTKPVIFYACSNHESITMTLQYILYDLIFICK